MAEQEAIEVTDIKIITKVKVPLHFKLARRLIHDFEYNPKLQFRFHLYAMIFWILNFIAGTCIMILFPHLWLIVGVYYVFALSIYANWDTDFDAVSASLAAMRAQEILDFQNNKLLGDSENQ